MQSADFGIEKNYFSTGMDCIVKNSFLSIFRIPKSAFRNHILSSVGIPIRRSALAMIILKALTKERRKA